MYKGYTQIIVERQDKILIIKFNNPNRRNCLNRVTYKEIGKTLTDVSKDDSITMVVFTGVGEFYSAGNRPQPGGIIEDMDAYIRYSSDIFIEMVKAFIHCPKVIVSLVNGPCIGVATTLAGLSDMIWCSETAYFLCPFVRLDIVPESCSSYPFPILLGRSKVSELLLMGEKMLPHEAHRYGFVTRVFKLSQLNTVIWPKLMEYAQLPVHSLQKSKALMCVHEKPHLLSALREECDELYRCLYSAEFINAKSKM